MSRKVETRLVRLEGIGSPCIILSAQGDIPEELEVNFSGTAHAEVPKHGPTTYRLEPSTAHDPQPLYRELFEE